MELSQSRLRSQARLLALSLVVGLAAGLGAIVFHVVCDGVAYVALDRLVGYHPPHPPGESPLFSSALETFRPWMLLLVPTLGGLLSGWLIFRLAPEAEGHGTDAAIAAFHYGQGQIRPRVPIIKIVTSALTIGTGGSGGREGPISQIGAGFGSFLARIFRLPAEEGRIVMAAGMGAGVAALFHAPLAGALFAAEVLYSSADFEASVIVPAALASAVAYSMFGMVFGWTPLFHLPSDLVEAMTFHDPRQLLPYTLLAIGSVVLAMLYTRTFYGLTDLFRRWRCPRLLKPAVGALATGAFGLALYYFFRKDLRVLSVLSSGYGALQTAITTRGGQGAGDLLLVQLFLVVALGKTLATALTIGSGGSGGLFGPAMVIGGCGGGALGLLFHAAWPSLAPQPASFALIGMASFFSAAAKTPLSSLIIVSEMTGSYGLLLPTLWCCVLAFLLSDAQSLYHSQVASRFLSPVHQGGFVREALAGLRARELLTPLEALPVLRPETRFSRVVETLCQNGLQEVAVADPDGRYVGMVCLEEVLLASRMPYAESAILAEDLMRHDIPSVRAEDTLNDVLEVFTRCDRGVLPVVDGGSDGRVAGFVKRLDISKAYFQRLHGRPCMVSAVGNSTQPMPS